MAQTFTARRPMARFHRVQPRLLSSIIEQRYNLDKEDTGFEISTDLSSSLLPSPCSKYVFHIQLNFSVLKFPFDSFF